MTKRLYRSEENKMLAGLMAGLAEYFDSDPVLVRLLYVMITIFTGVFPGIIAYLIGALIVPMAPVATSSGPVVDDTGTV